MMFTGEEGDYDLGLQISARQREGAPTSQTSRADNNEFKSYCLDTQINTHTHWTNFPTSITKVADKNPRYITEKI